MASPAPTEPRGPPTSLRPRVLVVGAGAIGGIVGAALASRGHAVTILTTNDGIRTALARDGFRVSGCMALTHAPASDVRAAVSMDAPPFDYVLLATQPPQVEEAARAVLPCLAADGRILCFQNGLCEERVARFAGRERIVGAVIAWGASMIAPGRYERTSEGGFTLGRLEGRTDDKLREIASLLEAVGPVRISENLLGARWSKLAINCAISTLGTIGGERVGVLMRRTFVRRLALEIMTETVQAARAAGVRLEKVAGTVDLDWLALTAADRARGALPGLAAKHAVLLAAGFRYRRLRSSMLAAIERGRPPAVDFLNGEVVQHGSAYGLESPVNSAARARVWQIARGAERPSIDLLMALYQETR